MTERPDNDRPVFAVIGGSSGIGLGVARVLLRTGAAVVLVGRSPERLLAAEQELASPGQVRTAAADVTDEDQVRRFFDDTGMLDHIIVTAADVAGYRLIDSMEIADARRLIDSKLIAALLIAKHAPTHLREGASITFTGGIATERPAPGGSVVAAVNSALTGLARALALELAPIRVNVLSPGWVDTPVWEKVAGPRKDAMLEDMARRLPVGRTGTPEDIGEAALFVTSARHLTGAVLPIDGGQRLV